MGEGDAKADGEKKKDGKKPKKGEKKDGKGPKEAKFFAQKPKKGKKEGKKPEGDKEGQKGEEGVVDAAGLASMADDLEQFRGILSDDEIESMKKEFEKLAKDAKALEDG